MKRASGILMPISSLPSRYGIGCFSKSAYEFVDQLKEAGQSYWQILPLGPTGYGDSPYQPFSTFAGNPYYISLEDLVEEGVLTEEECDTIDFGKDAAYVDYGKIYEGRLGLLKKAYERSRVYEDLAFKIFCQDNSWWLEDYALFMAVKECFNGISWNEWAEDIRRRWDFALDYYREKQYFEIEFYKYTQYKFYQQWMKLKRYANEKGILIIGDIPIYVAFDSADTWANPQLFQLDEKNVPIAVAGCPPDAFSATGQLWGNPLYCWEYHAQQGFNWWIKRMKHCFSLYDVVRIDHFRGFDEYYSIPYGDSTAENGHWEKGPGMNLFYAIRQHLGDRQIIAEDLGFMTDSVRNLVRESGYPNMKVLEFAFDSRDTGTASEYLPHNYSTNCVVYTGTHDNETLVSWFRQIQPEEREMVRDYLHNYKVADKWIYKEMIVMAMRSVARTCIVPIQDYLGLDNKARMNEPSTSGRNWRWRLTAGQFSKELRAEILAVTKCYGRL